MITNDGANSCGRVPVCVYVRVRVCVCVCVCVCVVCNVHEIMNDSMKSWHCDDNNTQ